MPNGFLNVRKGFNCKSRENVLVIAGQRQPIEVHLLAHGINSALNSIGNTVSLIPVTEAASADLKESRRQRQLTRWSFLAEIPLTIIIIGRQSNRTSENGCSFWLLRRRNFRKI
jgi:hypothetical protein